MAQAEGDNSVTSQTDSATYDYLDQEATVGITKHNGGVKATNELLALCHVEGAREVLYVGSGIGVGPCYIAKRYGCHVVGVDISERMIAWSRLRAHEDRVEDKTEFRVADVLSLPFEADRFDAVIIESVLSFVRDKQAAIAECVRVTRPGGYVGLNESVWLVSELPPQLVATGGDFGAEILTAVDWRALWERSGLRDRAVVVHRINMLEEVRSRLQWVGWRWVLRAWGRALKLFVTNRAAFRLARKQLDSGTGAVQYMGYALFAGRK